MSEIAKCPICGEDPLVMHKDSYSRRGIACCGHEIWSKDSPLEWNQYAAAMEWAKVCVDVDAAMRTDDDDDKMTELYEKLCNAETRVLEVFE